MFGFDRLTEMKFLFIPSAPTRLTPWVGVGDWYHGEVEWPDLTTRANAFQGKAIRSPANEVKDLVIGERIGRLMAGIKTVCLNSFTNTIQEPPLLQLDINFHNCDGL